MTTCSRSHHPHDSSLAKLPLDLTERRLQRFFLVWIQKGLLCYLCRFAICVENGASLTQSQNHCIVIQYLIIQQLNQPQ